MRQFDDMDNIDPIMLKNLTEYKNKEALEYLMFLKKRCDTIKG